jgi:hypothetical protein
LAASTSESRRAAAAARAAAIAAAAHPQVARPDGARLDFALPAVAAQTAAAAASADETAGAFPQPRDSAHGAEIACAKRAATHRAADADPGLPVAELAELAVTELAAELAAEASTDTSPATPASRASARVSGAVAVAVSLTHKEPVSMAVSRAPYLATAAAVGSTADGDLATAIAIAVAYALALALDTVQRRSDTLPESEACARSRSGPLRGSDAEPEQRDCEGESVRTKDEPK